LTRMVGLFRESIMAQQQARVAAVTQSTLSEIKVALERYAELLVTRSQRGIKAAFAISISSMLARALWIVVLGVLIILFIPEVPLRASS
jgi:hypothetical protein